MSTAEVLRVVGVHRVTLFRWARKGRFPPKHVAGGWLRSDIEFWLSRRALPVQASRDVLPQSNCSTGNTRIVADSAQTQLPWAPATFESSKQLHRKSVDDLDRIPPS